MRLSHPALGTPYPRIRLGLRIRRHHDAVSASVFCSVESQVRTPQQLLSAFFLVSWIERRGSDAHSHFGKTRMRRRHRFDVLALPLGDEPSRFATRARHQDEEFFAPVTSQKIPRTNAVGHALGDCPQHIVSGLVSELVVDPFEVVDVDEEQRETFAARSQSVDVAFERASIQKARQRIVLGVAAETLALASDSL